jgi:hypothetical protein
MRSAVDFAVGVIGVRVAVAGAGVAILALWASLRCNWRIFAARITGSQVSATWTEWRMGHD